MVASKINVKDNVNDGEIDLSMLDLQEVPVREIAAIKKAHALDLSNNHLVSLPKNFPTLVNLIKIDLSRNELKELPENFGDLVKLKHLDLYKNQLQHLPLSFSKLTALKWLDLKDNRLVPSISEVAGDCLDAKQCQKCAKDIVGLYSKLQMKVDEERKSREEQRQRSLEENAAKLKQEKKTKKVKTSKVSTEKLVKESKAFEVGENLTKTKSIQVEKADVKTSSASLSFIMFICKFLSFLTLLFGVCMITLRITKAKYGTGVDDRIREYILNDYIPSHLKDTLLVITDQALKAHDSFCNTVVELMGVDNVNIVWNAFTGVYHNVTQAGSEFYIKIFGK